MEEALTQADTSKNMTTTPPPESSEWTGRAHLSYSTVSCTRCATTALARSTQRPVSISIADIMHRFALNYVSFDSNNSNLTDFFFPSLSVERPPGYDRVRNAEIGNKDFELDVLEEAYTTEHWLVRIYKVG